MKQTGKKKDNQFREEKAQKAQRVMQQGEVGLGGDCEGKEQESELKKRRGKRKKGLGCIQHLTPHRQHTQTHNRLHKG